ncbi:hypothetical protein A3D07_00360 [Candidatus Curtissbacteria bacterium RIFCSPHIGHO2_02_FULL_42_15]|uniref:Glycosyltransferase RgtA/B/C/D-like domain-containing protein n=1 Tax=Candidatus Curtissbacteria bacterium RIFCSPHIGHO2_02_FULL_42_15 TaxID=1797716 RepID=A0A1F5GKD6_9BACT|nr:MAG: hypothetical protein A3D07_00360 [Candidatus Curtissbacteria bacterium RIFCSPHIGHO2_02_FULL_42_15]
MAKIRNFRLLVFLFVLFVLFQPAIINEKHFIYLAYSFLQGSFSLVKLPSSLIDFSYFNGQYFSPLGPVPAIILTPFVLFFKTSFPEQIIKLPLSIINFYLTYKIATKLKLAPSKSFALAVFFIFGSVYTPIAAISYSTYFSQVVTTSFLLFALYEFLHQRRWTIIGIAIALASLTRTTTLFASVFFGVFLIQKSPRITNLAKFVIPIISALILMMSYNYARFGNFFETGYRYQIVLEESAKRRELGLFSIKHIGTNIYYMLFKTPELLSHFPFLRFNDYGMSIFILSPALFLIFKAKFKDKLVKASLMTILVTLIPLITYYGIGVRQIGYRYALDLAPFLLIILASAFKKVDETLIYFLTVLSIFIVWVFTFEMLANF